MEIQPNQLAHDNCKECEDGQDAVIVFKEGNRDLMIYLMESSTNVDKQHRVDALLTRHSNIQLNYVKIGRSRIHGKGVFAVKNIRKGTYVTLCPVDVIHCSDSYIAHFSSIIHKRFRESCTDLCQLMLDYNGEKLDQCLRFGSHPGIFDDPSYLGHYINDSTDGRGLSKQSYNFKSQKKENVGCYGVLKTQTEKDTHLPLCFIVKALRDIYKGEELFKSYGYSYWKKRE